MYTSEIALICTIGYQTSLFSSSLVIVVLQYRQAYLENKVRYRDETLYNDGKVVQEHVNLFESNVVYMLFFM